MTAPKSLVLPLLLLLLLAWSGSGCGDASAPLAPGATAPTPPPSPGNEHEATAPREGDLRAWDYPSMACRANGDAWLACVHWEAGTDSLALRLSSRTAADETLVYTSPTRVLGTALAVDEADALHLVWSEAVADGWALRTLVIAAPDREGELGTPGAPVTLLSVPGARLLWPVLAADGQHALLLTCLSLDGTGPAVLALGRLPGGPWSAAVDVSTNRHSHWSPSATSTGPGRFAIAWDGATDGDYDIYLAECRLGTDGRPSVLTRQRLTDTPRRESHPSLAFDGERLYVAYDVAAEHWGREGSVNKLEEALHAGRQVEIVAVQDGQVAPLGVQPSVGMNDVLARNWELPKLAIESTGNLVLFFRGLPLPLEFDDPEDPAFQKVAQAKAGGLGWRTSIWFAYMTRFDGATWHLADKHHFGIPGGDGRADAGIACTRLPGGGMAYAVVGDDRAAPASAKSTEGLSPEQLRMRQLESVDWWRPVSSMPTTVTTGILRKDAQAAPFALGPARALPDLPAAAPGDAAALPTRLGPDGARLSLALGDLHRHTDLSRCSSNWDGPFDDALRYAYDVAPLQFLAITDHFEHMTAYDWWRSASWADAYDSPGRMVDLRAYERSEPSTGHRNVIARGDNPPLVAYRGVYDRERDASTTGKDADLWPLLDEHDVLTIPHTPAGMFPSNPSTLAWGSFDPRFDRLVEVFQSYRGNSEAIDAPRAIPGLNPRRYALPNLDLGMHFGFIASSDHQTSDGAFAGAWVGELTREGVFDALHARRTFASTVRASLWTEWNGVPMGTSAAAPAGVDSGFVVEVDGFGRALSALELIVDGTVSEQRAVHGSTAREGFELAVPPVGSRFAYVRVRFADGELMWSSPVRLSADGSQGADGLSGAQISQQHGDVWSQQASGASPASPATSPAPAGPR